MPNITDRIDNSDTPSRKEKISEWNCAQSNFDDVTAAKPQDFIIKQRPQKPKDSEGWKSVDEKFNILFAQKAPLSVDTDIVQYLATYKDCIYNAMVEVSGLHKHVEKTVLHKDHIDKQNKIVRKEKNAARKVYKALLRDGRNPTDQEVLDHNTHWKKLIRLHSKLKRQENAVNDHNERMKNNKDFCRNPFEFIKSKITKKNIVKNVTPNCSLKDANKFFSERYTDTERNTLISFPNFLSDPKPPHRPLEREPPTDDEISQYVMSRRNKSAPGPDGIPYIVFKKCKAIRYILCILVRKVFFQYNVPKSDCIAMKILTPKGSSRKLEEFRDLTLFNTTLKTVMGVWSKRVRSFMMRNQYFNTDIQKGFMPKISGCLEHNQTLIDIIRKKISSKKDAYIIWMDLQNAFGSVKHNLMQAALKFYNIPDDMIQLLMSLYRDCSVKVVTNDWTSDPFRVEKGSLQGGPEAGLVFNMAWNIGLEYLVLVAIKIGCMLEDKPVTAFADDLTLSVDERLQLRALVSAAEKYTDWAGLHWKDSKCLATGIKNGSLVNPLIPVNGKLVPAMHKKPSKYLGRMVYPYLGQKEEADVIVLYKDLLQSTDEIKIDDRKKAWMYENGVLPAMTWHFMIYRFTEYGISQMEACTTKYLKQWLKICKSSDPSVLYRSNKGLGIKSVRAICMKAQVNKEVILCCSKDQIVRRTASERREAEKAEGRPWAPANMLDDAMQQVNHNHMFKSQSDRRGLGHKVYDETVPCRKDISKEVERMCDEQMIPHILSLAQQSKWLDWDKVIDLDLKWKEVLYELSPSLLSFVMNSIQDTLPHPANLRKWSAEREPACQLCGWKNVGLIHILCGCKVALDQGRVSFRHDNILNVIAKVLQLKVQSVIRTVEPTSIQGVRFIKPGEKCKSKTNITGLLDMANDWIIQVDTRQHQVPFPPHILTTTERPDIVMYSNTLKIVIIFELTAPAEENLEYWRKKKRTKYMKLAENIRNRCIWKTVVFTVEVGARGFVSKSFNGVCRRLGISNKHTTKLIKDVSRMSMRCSHFIWICRNNKEWKNPDSML